MKYLVDYTVFARVLTGWEGYMDAFKWVNMNVGDIATLDTIYIDTIEYSYSILHEEITDFKEVFTRLSNVLRSLIDSTVSEIIGYSGYVEEAMQVSGELDINPRIALYLVAARNRGLKHVTMDESISKLEDVVYIEVSDI